MGTNGDAGCVQPDRRFLFRSRSALACASGRQAVRPSADQTPSRTLPPFGAIPRPTGMWRRQKPHDLGRAWFRTDPIAHPRTDVGPRHPDRGARRRPGRRHGGRLLCVRVDRTGRHGGGGGRGEPDLARSLPQPHAHPQSDADTDTDTDAATRTDPAAPATTATPSAEAHPAAEADAHTASRATTPARTAAAPGSRTPTGSGGPADTAPATTAARSEALTDPVGRAHPASDRDAGELPALPHPAAQPADPGRPVAGHLCPAHHRAGAARRRRPASALIPGGFRCRNGLFSPS